MNGKLSVRKVFNIGLNRAGTTSLAEAFSMLGLRAVHHKHNGIRLYDLLRSNVARNRRPFWGIEDRYDLFSDFAGQYCFQLLDRAYPGSKFIVTTRELESWLDSRERKIRKNLARPDYKYFFKTVDREGWTIERQSFLESVGRHFRDRSSDLLIMDIPAGEGWEKLCPFLGLSPPAEPFPRKNALLENGGG